MTGALPSAAEAINMAQQPPQDGCLPRFHLVAVENKFESEKQGRPIYADVPHVEIRIPGQPKSVVVRPVKEEDKSRWPRAWDSFEQAMAMGEREGKTGGTPLEVCNFLTPARIATLRHLSVYNVEQLAAVPDGLVDKLGMDGRELQEKAKKFLTPASEREQNATTEIHTLKQRVAELESELRQLQKQEAPKRGPGRPRKDEAA